ncbi:WD40-repeat-containing domain protein [Lyophyllum atratum]|nr:WD40-repeat-containing domain protein [Lyophyllum atratum]
MSASDPLTLPVVTIDPTFPSVIQDVHSGIIPIEKFWISCYKTSQPSVHAKVQAELDDVDRDLVRLKVEEGDVAITRGHDGTYLVSCEPLGVEPTPVLPPAQEYYDPERSNPQRPQRITAFDVSPDSTRFATGFLDGSVFLYPVNPIPSSSSHPSSGVPVQPAQTLTPSISARATARPHLSTITHLQFFPSSRVLLTAGADFSLSILPADLPEPTTTSSTTSVRLTPARSLRGHTRPITATAILGAGRNVLSASLDGTLKLWDVPSAAVIATLPTTLSQPVLSAIPGPSSSSSSDETTPSAPTDPREVPEVQTSTIFCGLQDGTIELFDLRTKRSAFRSRPGPTRSGIAALAHSARHHLLATGSTKGIVSIYDTRALPSGAVTAFTRGQGGAGVEDLAFLEGEGEGEARLVVATVDGLPYVAGVVPEGPAVIGELVGGDCDPVRCVRVREAGGEGEGEGGKRWDVWSAGDDAVVRRCSVRGTNEICQQV